MREDADAEFLQVGRPGFDSIGFGYRVGQQGLWAFHRMVNREFQYLAPSVREFLEASSVRHPLAFEDAFATLIGQAFSITSVVAPLVSILIPCCGMLEYTKLLIPSLLQFTRAPYELIFLDIGSLDGTAEYLAGLTAGQAQMRIEVVRTPTDLGISDACKEAIASRSCPGLTRTRILPQGSFSAAISIKGWIGSCSEVK